MPGPRAVAGLAILVLLLTALLVVAAAVVTVVGAWRARRVEELQRDVHEGRPGNPDLPLLRRLVLSLAGARSAADVCRLLSPDAQRALRVDALTSLQARRWQVRLRAGQVLAVLGPTEPLVRLLDDRVPVVRAAACAGVGGGSDAEVLVRVAVLLADRDPGVRHAAAEALARCGSAAAPALATLLATSPSAEVRSAALCLAAGPGAPSLLPYAEAAAVDADPLVRRAAATALVAVGDPFGRLRTLAADPDPHVAAAACRAAGALGEAALAAPLAMALRSSAWDVRSSAAAALAALGPPGVLVLRGAVDSPDAYARDAALAALGPAGAVSRVRR